MNRLHVALSISLLASVGLTGCAGIGSAAFPDASVNPAQITVGPIQGSNYGGHAPLAGAHIYVVEPGSGGYGSVVKGLLTASTGVSGFTTVQNGSWTNGPTTSDNFVPATDSVGNHFYGVTADLTGNFQLGSFTCDAGSPVIIIGYGGSPTFPSGSNVFTTTSVTVSGGNTATFTVNTVENAYIGESFVIGTTASGHGLSTGPTSLNGTTGTVIATNLTTTTFATITSAGLTNGTFAQTTTNQITFSPTFNPSAVNMAVIGNCPSSAPFNFGTSSSNPVKYVYMNEVSTTATAYAFAGFVSSTAHPQTGLDEFHIGSSGTAQATLGIQHAALTAGNLYDITGSNITTSYAGEGHIARTTTVGSNSTTTATVPQALIDTIGNILAACVDSNNTFVITSAPGVSPITSSGAQSPQCTALFQHATDNGATDTTTYNYTLPATGRQPFNIAQAAFSMANFPQGGGTGTTNSSGVQTITTQTPALATTWVTALYNIPSGNVPFTPNNVSTSAGVPDSWVIPISYNNATLQTPYRMAIDSQGSFWVVGGTAAGNTADYAVKFDAFGVQQASVTGVDEGTSIAIDISDNAWVTSGANSTLQKISSTGTVTQLTPAGLNAPYAIAIDNTGAPWFGNETGTSVVKLTSAGTVTRTITNADFNEVEGAAIDSNNNAWFANVGDGNITEVLSAGTAPNQNLAGGTSSSRIQIDASNNIWVANIGGTASLYGYTNAGVALTGSPYTVPTATITNPEGLDIDGNSSIWLGNAGSATTSTVTEFTNAGVYVANLKFPGQNNTRGAWVDPSGNVWCLENALPSNTLIELVGVAAPVVTPILPGKLGVRP
jgi:hypothetical protein